MKSFIIMLVIALALFYTVNRVVALGLAAGHATNYTDTSGQ